MTSAPSAPSDSVPAPVPDAGRQDTAGPADGLALLHVPDTADAATWLHEQRHALRAAVLDHGAVLVRGLGIEDPADVGRALRQLGAAPVTETEAFASRQTHGEGVYSSASWPPNQPMCMHHELSYTTEFPSLLLFACLAPPTTGGATTVADAAAVLDALPADVTEPFLREGWLLTRTYGKSVRIRRPRRRRAPLPGPRHRVRLAPGRHAAHPAAPQRRAAPPGDRPPVLVQPDRVPQRMDAGPRHP